MINRVGGERIRYIRTIDVSFDDGVRTCRVLNLNLRPVKRTWKRATCYFDVVKLEMIHSRALYYSYLHDILLTLERSFYFSN